MLPAEKRIFKAICPDKKCQTVLYVNLYEKTIECHTCGQKHIKETLQDVREISSVDVSGAVQNYICRMLINKSIPKRGIEMVKVLGLSNYYCKLLSPLLTKYGMDKNTGRAKLLSDMNQGEIFDCSLFGDRAFLIEPEHIPIHGFGKDITGSLDYLSETLKLIIACNEGEERLIPIHADGDGHCLVHAVSRALVGRELFWHPLRCCLKKHFEANLDKYKELFKDFIDTVEWPSIIEECDPNFQPPDGELHGLRNIHIFGLANVLRRPIILLDSLECMQKCGDYSALFLPGFVRPEACRGKDNALNKPLCIAWSSYSHNHYIPLVGVQKRPLPLLPSILIPKAWGMPQSEILSYMEFDNNGNCIVGGNRILSNAYIQRLVHAMEVQYYESNSVHPSLVADAKFYLYGDNILFAAKPAAVLERTKTAIQEGRLYRCLICRSLCELHAEDNWIPNSALCSQYPQNYKRIHQESQSINFQGLVLKYDSFRDGYVIDAQICTFCKSTSVRKVTNDGTVIFRAEDKDNLDRNIIHYDQGKKYYAEESFPQKSAKNTKPVKIPLKLHWDGKEVDIEIPYGYPHNAGENLFQYTKRLSKIVIEQNFSDKSSNLELHVYICKELWKVILKYECTNSSESPSNPETKKEDSAKTMKMENAGGSDVQSKSSHSQVQYVKVVASDGQQANLALTEDGMSYGQLQEWVKNEFNIPVRNQLIKKGFPPRIIGVFGDTNKHILKDLKHRDRLTVEIVERDDSPVDILQRGDSPVDIVQRYDSPLEVVENYDSDIIQSEDSHASENSFIPDRNVLKGSDLKQIVRKCIINSAWESLKKYPESFRRNGFIYNKIEGSNKLTSSLHLTLEEYPNKVFCYNQTTDCIELCVKPLGHFLISSDIDQRIDEVRSGLYVIGFSKCPQISKASDGMDDALSVLKTISGSVRKEDNQERPLLRKGPGFSVLRKPDDMDIS